MSWYAEWFIFEWIGVGGGAGTDSEVHTFFLSFFANAGLCNINFWSCILRKTATYQSFQRLIRMVKVEAVPFYRF